MRMYEKIWLQLKQNGKVRIAVPRPLHRRVIKAVLKEKNMDVGYKLEMLEKKTRLKITYEQQDSVITIVLNKSHQSFLAFVCAGDL